MDNKIVLIDGHSIINRAFYGVPDLTNKEGFHTNAIYGFLNILFKILEEESPSHLAIAFDVKAPTFRHEMYGEYKGTRKPMKEELRQQVPVMKELLKAMNITVLEQAGVEADDVLGTLARRAEQEGYTVSLISGDRDLLQLATEKITVRIPKTKAGKTLTEDYNTQDVIDHYGVTPDQIIDLKGLMGDSSDNIPGVPGIGEKTAVKILEKFHTVEEAIERVEELPQNRTREALKNNTELAKLCKVLATIKTDCVLDMEIADALIKDMFNSEAFALIQKLELKSLFNKFNTSVKTDTDIEERFYTIKTKSEADRVFSQCQKEKHIGIKIILRNESDKKIEEDGQFTLFETEESKEQCIYTAVSFGTEPKVYVIQTGKNLTGDMIKKYLLDYISVQGNIIVTGDLKGILEYFHPEHPEQCFDIGLAAYTINPTTGAYKEEDLADEYAGIVMNTYAQEFAKKSYQEAAKDHKEEFEKYISYCALVSYQSYEGFIKKLKKIDSLSLFTDIEMPLVFTLFDMEQRGVQVEKEELKKYGEQLAVRIKELEKEIYEKIGEEFNINSPKQLGIILFEKLKLPYAKKTKTGYSTSADVLEKLRIEDPVIDLILEYRQLTKLKSTYADGLSVYIKENGRIHSNFNQTITATGRISSTEPNLQNIPIRMELGRQIRKVFVPKDGFVFLDADYSQIELRILAHMAADKRLIDAYKENADIHQTTASLVFHTPYEKVTELQRRNAKAVNFGIVYGISGFGLSRDLNITKKEAQKYITDYFETYPQVKEFIDRLVEQGKEKGYVTTMFGRRRPIPELSSSNFMQRQFGERIAMNSPIQGTSADIIKIAMINVNERLKEKLLESQLVLQIHDELLVETKINEIEIVTKILQEEMEQAAHLSVPLLAEVKQGSNWYEAK